MRPYRRNTVPASVSRDDLAEVMAVKLREAGFVVADISDGITTYLSCRTPESGGFVGYDHLAKLLYTSYWGFKDEAQRDRAVLSVRDLFTSASSCPST